jgi:hypothetical protein
MNLESDLDSVMESKLRENLKWSMLFFVFNYITSELEKKEKDTDSNINISNKFFKNWRKHTCENLVKKDLETINSILNSPKNIFYSILQNSGDTIESTELYQEKYNNILKKVEEFYTHNTSNPLNNNE